MIYIILIVIGFVWCCVRLSKPTPQKPKLEPLPPKEEPTKSSAWNWDTIDFKTCNWVARAFPNPLGYDLALVDEYIKRQEKKEYTNYEINEEYYGGEIVDAYTTTKVPARLSEDNVVSVNLDGVWVEVGEIELDKQMEIYKKRNPTYTCWVGGRFGYEVVEVSDTRVKLDKKRIVDKPYYLEFGSKPNKILEENIPILENK